MKKMAIRKNNAPATKKATTKTSAKATKQSAPSKAQKSTALAKRGSTAVQGQVMDFLAGIAGKGTQNITQQDLGMPYLKVLQALSPETQTRHERYIEDAEPGMFLLTSHNELFEEEVRVIPVHFESRVQEWWPRNSKKGEGLVATHTNMTEAKRNKFAAETVLNMTHFWFVAVWSEAKESWIPAIFACDRTKLKPSKDLVKLTKNHTLTYNGETFPAPMFAREYMLRVTEQVKDDYQFFNLEVLPGDDITDMETLQFLNDLSDESVNVAKSIGNRNREDAEVEDEDEEVDV